MWEKIKRAAFTGELLSKSINFIIRKLPGIILNKLDWSLGYLLRICYSLMSQVNPKQIMFIPFQGDYTCNPKYIAEELQKRGCDYHLIFSARQKSMYDKNTFPSGIKVVEQYSMEYYEEIAKSKLIVANSVEFLKKPTLKKKSQIIIETWHGSLGIKRFDADHNSGRSWVAAAKRCGKRADFIISNSKFENDVYRGSFWKNTPILEYGHPRNDILLKYTSEQCSFLREKILQSPSDSQNQKLLLYAPTFRDGGNISCYDIDFEALKDALTTRFGGEWKILVRLHPTARKRAKKYFSQQMDVIDVTSYPDIQEIMLISDIAITDYSSWIYDFVLTGRPGFIYASDMGSYVTERGFYYPLTETPFPVATNNNELVKNILTFNEDIYVKKVKLFLSEKGCLEDGCASQRVADKIIELMG